MNIGIVIPCYNEEKRLPLAEFAAHYAVHPDISYCFVNDGSSDSTLSLLTSLAKDRGDRISVLSLPRNGGKAEAVRAGVLHVLRGPSVEYVGYLDADLATPLDEMDRLLACSKDVPSASLIFGSRVKRLGAHIVRSPLRHYLGRVFAAASSSFLGIPAYDTQCGAKLIRSSVAGEIFREPFIGRWIFDVELFLRTATLVDAEPEPFVEVPLNKWTEKGRSRIGIKDAAASTCDFMLIWRKYKWVEGSKKLRPKVRRAC